MQRKYRNEQQDFDDAHLFAYRPAPVHAIRGSGTAPEHQTQDEQFQDTVQGDGNYQAARDYQRDAKDFAESGKVDEAPRAAQPEGGQQARNLEQAETARPERAKK